MPAKKVSGPVGAYEMGASETPLVSVIIPSYQAAWHIRTALQALLVQETSVSYEVIVVDSSTDGTDRIIEASFPQVRLLHFPDRRQVGTARNIGVAAARGAVIVPRPINPARVRAVKL